MEALYFSLLAKRLHPDEDDSLVGSPAVTPVGERVPRVRPPHGFALFLAKEEARKVKRLHGMLKVSPAVPWPWGARSCQGWGRADPGAPLSPRASWCTCFSCW